MIKRLEYILNVIKGKKSEGFVPVIPIYHTGAAFSAGVSLKEFVSSPEKMAEVMVWAYETLNLDGVQLTLGVAAEAEAMGAETKQPDNGLPVVTSHPLKDVLSFEKLNLPDPYRDGRLPIFIEAVSIVQKTIGEKACVIATIRGPLNIAAQLRGLNNLMLDIYDRPDFVEELLQFSTEVAFCIGKALVKETNAPVIAIGEALCSPDFVSPDWYKDTVAPLHKKLIKRLHESGLEIALIHICGNITPIMDSLIDTGIDAIDIDAKTDLVKVLKLAKGVGLRGNLDPSWLLSASASEIRDKTRQLLRIVHSYPWILSSGCDVPYGTPLENLKAMVEAAKKNT